ncbi:MAG: beta-lactamase family protein [Saprospiraceae bacterium]|nr:beta-lactamase family protein [Saprospiraceae bacterium]
MGSRNKPFVKTLAVSIVFYFFGCSSVATQSRPQAADTYWERSNPIAEGIDPLAIDGIHEDIIDGKYGLIDHFMVIRNGKLVADKHYVNDYETIAAKYDTTEHQYNYDHPVWHPYYKYSKLHTLQSVTKSITSVLLGIAIDEGLISDIREPVMSLLSEYQVDQSDERKQAMTLEDLLTMRSGIQWDETSSYNSNENSCIIMELSDDWIQYVLSQPLDAEPGSAFEYNSGASVLIGKIVGLATGKHIDKWAEEKLFGPLGITDYYWKVTPKGEIDTEGGLYLAPHDLAKIGYLMLRGGKWEHRQIVSRDWVERSTRPVVKVSPGGGYGYQWWVPDHRNGTTEIFAGNGYGGQFVMIAPAHEIVVVFNGWNIHDGPEKSAWRVLQDRIIPGIR